MRAKTAHTENAGSFLARAETEPIGLHYSVKGWRYRRVRLIPYCSTITFAPRIVAMLGPWISQK